LADGVEYKHPFPKDCTRHSKAVPRVVQKFLDETFNLLTGCRSARRRVDHPWIGDTQTRARYFDSPYRNGLGMRGIQLPHLIGLVRNNLALINSVSQRFHGQIVAPGPVMIKCRNIDQFA
jgi:hypothetical protein